MLTTNIRLIILIVYAPHVRSAQQQVLASVDAISNTTGLWPWRTGLVDRCDNKSAAAAIFNPFPPRISMLTVIQVRSAGISPLQALQRRRGKLKSA